MQDWQQEEKKKKQMEEAEGEGDEKEEEKKGEEESEEPMIENIEGVDTVALKKFIAKEVQKFFDQKLSEILNPAVWAAHGA